MGERGAGQGAGRVHPAEKPLDVVVFLPALSERGAGEEGIAPCTDLGADVPTGQLAERSPRVRCPHRGLRSLTVPLLPPGCCVAMVRTCLRGSDGDARGEGRGSGRGTDGRRPRWVPRAPIHRDSGCVSAVFQHHRPDHHRFGAGTACAGLRTHCVTWVTVWQMLKLQARRRGSAGQRRWCPTPNSKGWPPKSVPMHLWPARTIHALRAWNCTLPLLVGMLKQSESDGGQAAPLAAI